jgi:ribosome assembly protein YihI (activator of Der GTPase)
MTTAEQQLQELHHLLPSAQDGSLPMSEWVKLARNRQALLDALPEKFAVVFNDLLDRLESGALFSEESCSFSLRDLLDSLQTWMDKAALRLPN